MDIHGHPWALAFLEDLEAQIRAALLQDQRSPEAGTQLAHSSCNEDPGDADLPQIIEVTELHTYYYMEDSHGLAKVWVCLGIYLVLDLELA